MTPLPPDVEGMVSTLGHHAPDADSVKVLDTARQRIASMPRPSRWVLLRWRVRCAWLRAHCWHPADEMIGWECCSCPAETDGMPRNRCRDCRPS